MFWRIFRKGASPKIDTVWWQSADAASENPTGSAIESLAKSLSAPSAAADEFERQEEMLTGLRELAEVARADALPVVSTQHRAIGPDTCHFIAPVSLAVEGGGAGKIFLTSARLIFVGGRLRSWPWHRLRRVARSGRDVVIVIAGEADDVILQCNTYGEALVAKYIVERLAPIR